MRLTSEYLRWVATFLSLLMADGRGQSPDPESGPVLWGTEGYAEYRMGNMPLIIAAPHGGTLRPAGFPDRLSVTESRYDTNSLELAVSIFEAFERIVGRRPHLILLHVHRSKLDANRDVVEAAQGDSAATALWEEFHGFITQAREHVLSKSSSGLFIDLHGHRHPQPWLELGYLLQAADLALPDDSLNVPALINQTSIRALSGSDPSRFSDVVRGPKSLGALFEREGYPSVPSPRVPSPPRRWYFSGGYNTEAHGSRDGGSISAIQLETPMPGVRDTEISRRRFAEAVVRAVSEFLRVHCDWKE